MEGNPLILEEIPYYITTSLTIERNPLLYQRHKHNLQPTKITNMGKYALACTGIHMLKNTCSRAGENIILNTLNVTSDMGMVLSPA